MGQTWVSDAIGPWSFVNSVGAYQTGNAFEISADGYLEGVWYRSHSGSSPTPTRISVWRVSDQVRIFTQTTGISAPTVSGWSYTALSSQPALVAGETYRITVY